MNPQGLKNQIGGAVLKGLGGALFEAIHFENGRILNPHLAEYRVPRFSDPPRIDVVLVDRKGQPSMGAGETPRSGVAPAVANAIFSRRNSHALHAAGAEGIAQSRRLVFSLSSVSSQPEAASNFFNGFKLKINGKVKYETTWQAVLHFVLLLFTAWC